MCKVIKRFGLDFHSEGGALTLDPSQVMDSPHQSGWSIDGEIHEDYYEWVNFFKATHPTYGVVEGDFESEVVADSEEAFQHFYRNHPPVAWDYGDI